MKKYLLLVIILYLFFPIFEKINFNNNEARLIFFSIGQGDSAMLISPQGKTLLIDGGPSKLVVEKIGKFLNKREKTIDWLILSHEHDDHYLGLIAASDYYKFSQAILPTWTKNSVLLNWYQVLKEDNTQMVEIGENKKRFYLEDNCFFDVLASPLLFINENVSANNASFSVKIDCYGIEALFTGDLEREGEMSLLELNDINFLSAKIFKAGHHGSNTSSNIEFLEVVKPSLIVISVGKNNSYEHPGKIAIENMKKVNAKIMRTDLNGNIEILSNNKEIFIINQF
jgi:competence protein ComEC